ncbi:hypothetical protein DL96DRAFT_1679653 [Flagelloscypha sp. PMI_526]|nr:hypothetical protein DL96DRAFT_1679653 [Flagelloscypha sp. PMI_526]
MSTIPSKFVQERSLKTLLELVALPGNDICADCKTRNPRWASWSLGIFICVNCASIHRKIGTHVTKVKSITMDAWTKEQVERMREMGNLNSNAIFNPNETRFPPPPNTVDPERDSELELYIRNKYEYKKFFDRGALVAAKLGPSRSASSVKQKTPSPAPPARKEPSPAPPVKQSQAPPAAQPSSSAPPNGLVSAPPRVSSQNAQLNPPQGSVWNDLVSIQTTVSSGNLPLQVLSPEAQFQAQSMGLTGQPQLSQPTGMPFGAGLSPPGMQMMQMQTGVPMMNTGMNQYFSQPQPQMMTGMMGQNVGMPMMTGLTQQPSGMMMMQQPQAGYVSPPSPMQPPFGTPSPQPQFTNQVPQPMQYQQQYGSPMQYPQQMVAPQMQVPQQQQGSFTNWMTQQAPAPGTWGSM